MPATLLTNGTGTFGSILKEFYLGPIQEQLNNEAHVLELFEKVTVDWNGKYAVLPIRTGRNTGVGFRTESGGAAVATNANLPTIPKDAFLGRAHNNLSHLEPYEWMDEP